MNVVKDKQAKLNYNAKSDETKKISAITETLSELLKEKDGRKLEFDSDYNIVKLTKNNAKIIEKRVENDPDYIPFAKYVFEYFKSRNMERTKEALFAVIREIDRDNSTNVWRYKTNRKSLYDVIDHICKEEKHFFQKLENPEVGLPDELVDAGGPAVRSLSSKICKYLSEYMYRKDSYYINDSYIRHALLFYLDYYKIDRETKKGTELKTSREVDQLSYEDLHFLLEKLKEKSEGLKKSELDHIIWYCYKSFKT